MEHAIMYTNHAIHPPTQAAHRHTLRRRVVKELDDARRCKLVPGVHMRPCMPTTCVCTCAWIMEEYSVGCGIMDVAGNTCLLAANLPDKNDAK